VLNELLLYTKTKDINQNKKESNKTKKQILLR